MMAAEPMQMTPAQQLLVAVCMCILDMIDVDGMLDLRTPPTGFLLREDDKNSLEKKSAAFLQRLSQSGVNMYYGRRYYEKFYCALGYQTDEAVFSTSDEKSNVLWDDELQNYKMVASGFYQQTVKHINFYTTRLRYGLSLIHI